MISVIICSINKGLAQQVQKNIAATIGVVWEFVVIENTVSPKSLTEVYNVGASKAKYDVLLFVHEDVLFQTKNWGEKLLNYFEKDNSLGLIGIAGSKYKSSVPSGWFSGIEALDCCNILHVDSNDQKLPMYFNPAPGTRTQDVVVLDGVLLCCKKNVWQQVKFDETLLKGFHLYDIDFSFRVAQKFKVIVSFEIDLIHLTEGGNFGDDWVNNTMLWHSEKQSSLPFYTKDLSVQKSKFESVFVRNWLIRLKHEDISFSNKITWLYKSKTWRYITAWPFVVLFLFKRYFKTK